jgi:hypothetical protein
MSRIEGKQGAVQGGTTVGVAVLRAGNSGR